jgi:drug/metabolite transporter (DMT)-like permease
LQAITDMPLSVRYMMLSAFCFALLGACVKATSMRGIPVLEVLAARALISSILSYGDIYRKGISPWGRNRFLLFMRGLVGTLALMCVFYAVTTIPLAEATLLQFLYPAFTALLGLVFLRESVQWPTILCIVLSTIGLVVIVQPDFLVPGYWSPQTPLNIMGVGAGLLGALGSGIAYVIVRRLSKTEDASVIIFYFPFIALPISCILLGNDFVMPSGFTWVLLLLVGVFTQIAQYGLTKAMQLETAGKASAYAYVQVLFAALLGWIFFAETPTLTTTLGALLITGGAIINVLATEKK